MPSFSKLSTNDHKCYFHYLNRKISSLFYGEIRVILKEICITVQLTISVGRIIHIKFAKVGLCLVNVN